MLPRADIAGERVVMRPNSVEFAEALQSAAMESLATVGRWMPWCHPQRTVADGIAWYRTCREKWDAGLKYEFSMFTPEGDYLGTAGLNQFNRVHNFANLGYRVRESRQGQGLAVEAARLIADFGFRSVGLSRIEIVVAEGNAPSRRVAEKLGAAYEGIARNRLLLRGTPTTAAMYSLVPQGCP